MNTAKSWYVGLVLTSAAVLISYVWIDRPLAFWAYGPFHGYAIFDRLTLAPGWLPPIAVAIVFIAGLRSLSGRPLDRFWEPALICGISLLVARAAKDQLKFVFGRTWPETWVNGNPSLIRDGVFGFNPFHGGAGFESFPSGHTTAICSVAAVLWVCYPRFRILYVFLVAVVVIGLIGANYHFLSDIIAGGFLGVSTATFCVSSVRALKTYQLRMTDHAKSEGKSSVAP